MFINNFFRLLKLNRLDSKLGKYNGYRASSIGKWIAQMDLSWNTAYKVIDELKIITSIEIRRMLKATVKQNSSIFNSSNCYICKFGEPGKSGEILLYEFRHACSEYSSRIIETWEIPNLPENSRIIFVDDLLGTGQQSVEYIGDVVNPFLNPSHNAFLLSLCGTPQGIQNIKANTNFQVICHLNLDEEKYQHYSCKSTIFNDEERKHIKQINDMLSSQRDLIFDKGLLIAFYYTVPNNTMPFIWKDNHSYTDPKRGSKNWFALLPRKYG